MAAYRPRNALLDVVQRARLLTDAVCVGMSCGKDSLALLDVCCQHFDRVEAFYWYVTPGLSFHERAIAQAEKRYGIKVRRIPHFALSILLRASVCRKPSLDTLKLAQMAPLKLTDLEAEMRRQTGIEWIATGQKRHDSLERVAMLNKCQGIDHKTKRIYPLAWWSDAHVYRHLRRRRIPLSAEYAVLGHSYGGDLMAKTLIPIRDRFPEDFQRIVERFPFVLGEIYRAEHLGDGEGRHLKAVTKKTRKEAGSEEESACG